MVLKILGLWCVQCIAKLRAKRCHGNFESVESRLCKHGNKSSITFLKYFFTQLRLHIHAYRPIVLDLNTLTNLLKMQFTLVPKALLFTWILILISSFRLTIVQSLNSPFFPPPIGAEPGRAKKRVQDNLHAHAQSAAIFFSQIGGKTIFGSTFQTSLVAWFSE